MAPLGLKTSSFNGTSAVELRAFTTDLQVRLHTLYTQ